MFLINQTAKLESTDLSCTFNFFEYYIVVFLYIT